MKKLITIPAIALAAGLGLVACGSAPSSGNGSTGNTGGSAPTNHLRL